MLEDAPGRGRAPCRMSRGVVLHLRVASCDRVEERAEEQPPGQHLQHHEGQRGARGRPGCSGRAAGSRRGCGPGSARRGSCRRPRRSVIPAKGMRVGAVDRRRAPAPIQRQCSPTRTSPAVTRPAAPASQRTSSGTKASEQEQPAPGVRSSEPTLEADRQEQRDEEEREQRRRGGRAAAGRRRSGAESGAGSAAGARAGRRRGRGGRGRARPRRSSPPLPAPSGSASARPPPVPRMMLHCTFLMTRQSRRARPCRRVGMVDAPEAPVRRPSGRRRPRRPGAAPAAPPGRSSSRGSA